jgi:hypothetical protein
MHAGNFVIIGPTRYGKTTVLQYLAGTRKRAGEFVYALHAKPHDWKGLATWRTRDAARFVQELDRRQGGGSFMAVIDDSISFKGCWDGSEGLSRVFTDFGEGGVQAFCVAHRYLNIVPPVVRANCVNVIAFKMPLSDARALAEDRVCPALERAAHLEKYQFIMLFNDKVACFQTLESGGIKEISLP